MVSIPGAEPALLNQGMVEVVGLEGPQRRALTVQRTPITLGGPTEWPVVTPGSLRSGVAWPFGVKVAEPALRPLGVPPESSEYVGVTGRSASGVAAALSPTRYLGCGWTMADFWATEGSPLTGISKANGSSDGPPQGLPRPTQKLPKIRFARWLSPHLSISNAAA